MLSGSEQAIVDEASFANLLSLERKRTDRSGRSFLLLLLEIGVLTRCGRRQRHRLLTDVSRSVKTCIRQTDVVGWYKTQAAIGVIFTEIRQEALALETIREKVMAALRVRLRPEQVDAIVMSVYVYPQQDKEIGNGSTYVKLYPECRRQRVWRLLKRLIDVLGGFSLLVLFSPLLLIIGVAIKCTSKGPVLFKQERIGQFGQAFTFLKFRSMYADADPEMHKQYIQAFIRGSKSSAGVTQDLKRDGLYKLSHDPRVTPLGGFLRRTSLDELPQLINVLLGTMSLVGPRPPVSYEIADYDPWHMRRVLEAKPGITGLWQVKGRSRTTFDETVRLDLQYVDQWSLWTDVKILLQTPWVVLKCDGAR